MAKVVVVTSDGQAQQIELDRPTTTVGRLDQSDIVIRGPLVSRTHALVSLERGRYTVSDLDSSNGTFVNGLKVRRQVLRHEDVIRIGDCEVRFLDDANAARAARTGTYSLA